MDDGAGLLPGWLTAAVRWVSLALAVAGGAVLVLIVVVTDLSIAGRVLIPFGLRPIQGDYEIVEAGTAFAIFAFMPWCQFNRRHASVDVFTARMPPDVLRFIDFLVDVAFVVVIAIIIWRTGIGLGDKYRNGQLTFILQMPVWWTYAAAMVGGAAWVAVSLYCLAESAAALIARRNVIVGADGGR
jgi:TRAP-type C4-dicarboxylate transport system permease small subunit